MSTNKVGKINDVAPAASENGQWLWNKILYDAVLSQDQTSYKTMRGLVQKGKVKFEDTYVDRFGRTALHLAAEKGVACGDISQFVELIKIFNIDQAYIAKDGSAAIHYFAQPTRHPSLVEALSAALCEDHKSRINCRMSSAPKGSLLYIAAINGDIELFDMLHKCKPQLFSYDVLSTVYVKLRAYLDSQYEKLRLEPLESFGRQNDVYAKMFFRIVEMLGQKGHDINEVKLIFQGVVHQILGSYEKQVGDLCTAIELIADPVKKNKFVQAINKVLSDGKSYVGLAPEDFTKASIAKVQKDIRIRYPADDGVQQLLLEISRDLDIRLDNSPLMFQNRQILQGLQNSFEVVHEATKSSYFTHKRKYGKGGGEMLFLDYMEAENEIHRVSLIESALVVTPTVRVAHKRHAETIDSNQKRTDTDAVELYHFP